VEITLTGADVEGRQLKFMITLDPRHGVLSEISNLNSQISYLFTPEVDYHGSDELRFRVNDGTLDSDEVVVSITVVPVNDAPIVNDRGDDTPEDEPLAVLLTATDIDSSPDAYSFIIVAPPVHGVLEPMDQLGL